MIVTCGGEAPPPRFAPHFSFDELRCKCGCDPSPEIVARLARLSWALERLRADVGAPITVISGHRCPARNRAVRGAPKSRHLEGDAADVQVRGWTGEQLRARAEGLITAGELAEGGLGTYRAHPATLHYDQRGEHARWRL